MPSYNHESFLQWLDTELRGVALATTHTYTEVDIEIAKENIARIVSASYGEAVLLNFISVDSIEDLPKVLLETFMLSLVDTLDVHRLIRLAVKLNIPNVINNFKLASVLDEEVLYISVPFYIIFYTITDSC